MDIDKSPHLNGILTYRTTFFQNEPIRDAFRMEIMDAWQGSNKLIFLELEIANSTFLLNIVLDLIYKRGQ